MIDWYIICTRCKIEKHVWSGNDGGLIHNTIPAEFCEKHFKKGCSFKDLYFYESNFSDELDIENYTEDKDKYFNDYRDWNFDE